MTEVVKRTGTSLFDLFDKVFADRTRFPTPASLWEPIRDTGPTMRVEERTEDGEFVIRAEMPGIDPDEDVDIHVRDHSLELRAERREEEKTDEEEGRVRSEFRYGRFVRTVPLPPDADESSVDATYKDGILEVRMPVDEKRAEATRIEVTKG